MILSISFLYQFVKLKYITIKEVDHSKNVHSMHISKISKIKPHVDANDKEASIIIRFNILIMAILKNMIFFYIQWSKFCLISFLLHLKF